MGVEMANCCFEEATHTSAELTESQHQEREFMDRVLYLFAATYDTHRELIPCRPGVVGKTASQPLTACHALLQGVFPGKTGTEVP